jgi:hypothetical protein
MKVCLVLLIISLISSLAFGEEFRNSCNFDVNTYCSSTDNLEDCLEAQYEAGTLSLDCYFAMMLSTSATSSEDSTSRVRFHVVRYSSFPTYPTLSFFSLRSFWPQGEMPLSDSTSIQENDDTTTTQVSLTSSSDSMEASSDTSSSWSWLPQACLYTLCFSGGVVATLVVSFCVKKAQRKSHKKLAVEQTKDLAAYCYQPLLDQSAELDQQLI